MFGTWGPGDLTELQRNMKFYNLLSLIRGPIHFYDVQKLFAIQYETMKSRRALEYAADFLHLPKDEHFHQALSDAKYTADIFARIDMDVVLAYDSIDVYQNPKSKKRRSTPSIMATRNSSPANSTQKKKPCTTARSAARTAASAGKRQENAYAGFRPAENYYCVAWCPEHGYLKGKARMKHSDEGKLFVVKTIRISSEQEAGKSGRRKRTCGRRGIRRGKKCKKGRGNGNGIKGFISSAF